MQAIKKGQLLQYKRKYYGRFYSELPKVPFDDDYKLLFSSLKGYGPPPWFLREETQTKKYTLFVAKVVTIYHPRTDLLNCDYVLCFISDPYEAGETREGWVRSGWVEPLNSFQTYEDEERNAVQEVFQNLKENSQKKKLTPLEVFQELKKKK